MISANRIIEIFRTRGGGAKLIACAENLPPDQLKYVRVLAEGEPLVAILSSENEWFVLTETHFVIERSRKIHRVPFADIYNVEIPRWDFMNPRIKSKGGNLDILMENGAPLRIKVEPGGPYFSLMNVLMRIAAVNRGRANAGRIPPTTDDQRPTTQS